MGEKKYLERMQNNGEKGQKKEYDGQRRQNNEEKKDKYRQREADFNIFSVLKIEKLLDGKDDEIENDEIKEKAFIEKEHLKKAKKSKKEKSKSKKYKYNDKKERCKRSLETFSTFLRCSKCFRSHFPNQKFCRWVNSAMELKKFCEHVRCTKEKKNLKSENGTLDNNFIKQITNRIAILEMSSSSDMSNTKLKQKHIRLRGGFNVQGNIQSLMVTKALESARKHGANLIQGKLNQADGNCVFESVIHNINLKEIVFKISFRFLH